MAEPPFTLVRDPFTGATVTTCVRRADGALIPADPDNVDWQAYEAWRDAGNLPLAAAPRGESSAATRPSP